VKDLKHMHDLYLLLLIVGGKSHFCVDVQVNILSVLFAFLLNFEVFLTVSYAICLI
jgi:hypothetical protein